MTLNFMDIKNLARDPSPHIRAELVGKISQSLQQSEFAPTEEGIALDILRILARDLEVQVRRSVALSLCNSINIPHDIIHKLAHDVADVALPILQFSKALTDEDLIQIAEQSEEVVKLISIAKREQVSEPLSSSLMRSDDDKVIYTLFRNSGATISDQALTQQWKVITSNNSLVEALVQRGTLSTSIAEKLYAAVSDEMKRYIAKSYRLPMAVVEDTIDEHREWKTIDVFSSAAPSTDHSHGNANDVESLVHQLFTSNRLTYSIIIRALCSGDLAFFEASLSRLAGVPRSNAQILIYDSGPLGFRAFYDKARMPAAFYEAIRCVLKIVLDMKDKRNLSADEFRDLIVQRVQDEGLDYSIENMHYMLSLVINNTANINA